MKIGVWHSLIIIFFSLIAWRRLNSYLNSSSYLFGAGRGQAQQEEFYSEKRNFSFLVQISANYYKSFKDLLIESFKEKIQNKDRNSDERSILDKFVGKCENNEKSLKITRTMSSEENSRKRASSVGVHDKVYKGKMKKRKEEIKEVKEENVDKTCCICYNNQGNSVFMPCGHGGFCYTCCVENWKEYGQCPICRCELKEVLVVKVNHRFNIGKVIWVIKRR